MRSLLLEKCGNKILIRNEELKQFTVLSKGDGSPLSDKMSTFFSAWVLFMLEIQYNKNDSDCYFVPKWKYCVFRWGKYKSCGYTLDSPHKMLL